MTGISPGRAAYEAYTAAYPYEGAPWDDLSGEASKAMEAAAQAVLNQAFPRLRGQLDKALADRRELAHLNAVQGAAITTLRELVGKVRAVLSDTRFWPGGVAPRALELIDSTDWNAHLGDAAEVAADAADDVAGSEETSVLVDLLSLVGVTVTAGDIELWTPEQREAARDWAAREHLNASDNPVRRAPKPPFLADAEARR